MAPGRARWRAGLAVAVLVAVMAALAVTSQRHKSAVFDEIIHLPPGYASLALGDFRMNPAHPPLVRALAALPLLFLDVRLDPEDHAWKTSRPWEWGKRFLYRWNDGDRLLFWGRLPIVALAGVLVVAVFLWTRRLYGETAGLVAAALAALSPDVIAHGRIVTNDLAITLCFFLAVMAFERLTERVTPARIVWAGAAVGAAFATKFSALGLVPILAGLAVVVALRKEPLVMALRGERRVEGRGVRLAWLALIFALMALIAVAVIWAAFFFRSPLATDPEVNAAFRWETIQPRSPMVRAATDFARGRILPEAWVWGYLFVARYTESRPAFLLGQRSETGWWYYFPTTFALKTPIPLLVLVGVALGRLWRGGDRRAWFVWLPIAVYLGLTMTRGINIGHRHLLPIYPFVFVAAGEAAGWLWQAREPLRRAARGAVVALLAWSAYDALAIYPHYLAFFNALAGGPGNGYRRLVDSSLDWGQDLPGLKRYMEKNGIPRVKLSYFGTADPAYHGIAADRLPGYQPPPPSTLVTFVRPGDVLAISATHLQGLYLDPEVQPLMALLRERRPIASIGYSILVYRADFSWDLPSEGH